MKEHIKKLSFTNRLTIGIAIRLLENLVKGMRKRKDEIYSSMNDDFNIGYNTCINDLEAVKTEMLMIKGEIK